MKIVRLFLLLLIAGLFLIPAVSADEIIVDTTYTHSAYVETTVNPTGSQAGCWGPFKGLLFTPTYDFVKTNSIQWQAPSAGETASPSNNTEITLKGRSSGQTYGYADYGYFRYKVGGAIWVQYYIENIEWVKETPVASDYTGSGVYALLIDVPTGELANPQSIYGTGEIQESAIVSYYGGNSATWVAPWGGVGGSYTNGLASTGNVLAISKIEWANRLLITRESGTKFNYDYITVYKDIAEMGNSKTRVLYDNGSEYNDDGDTNTEFRIAEMYQPYTVAINDYYQEEWYNVTIGEAAAPETPESASVSIYVQNSQTGALIAGAQAVVSAGFYDPAELIEVSNTTLAGGTKTYTLQPTGGGLPNPDYYRVSVTADGYNAEMPYADITLDPGMSMTMVMGMEPTAGAPEDPGYTYIDVYVRDIYANPIADATVKMGVYTLKTNAAGYTLFDVPVNSTYTYTVKKTGYTTIEGSVSVADAARYTVNVVMGTGVIPTNTPPAEPTVPGATPTVPAGEETPGPGFIDQSAKNFATFLGVSYAVGRAALGMLIATAIGFTTARKLKGGAPEFGIGFIAGAALMVLITLLPAWIFIVMVIIVGGLLGYKYMSGGS